MSKEKKAWGVERWCKQMDDQGRGSAVFATLNVIDKDGDVTLPGAFGNQTVQVIPTHNWAHVPIGKAVIREEGNEVIADFKLNLDIEAARDWHSALKNDLADGEPIQEWSFGFDVVAQEFAKRDDRDVRILKELKVHEISPVIVGAGVNTRTTAVKSERKAGIPIHKTETKDGVWDVTENERRILSGQDPEYYQKVYGWCNHAGDVSDTKSWGYAHHYVSDDGTPNDASVRACMTGIALLNGAQGGISIPDNDRKNVYTHLSAHLKDAGYPLGNIPELQPYGSISIKLADQIQLARWEAEAAINRCKEVKEDRLKDTGRDLSPSRYDDLKSLKEAMDNLLKLTTELGNFLQKDGAPTEAELLLAQHTKNLYELNRLS